MVALAAAAVPGEVVATLASAEHEAARGAGENALEEMIAGSVARDVAIRCEGALRRLSKFFGDQRLDRRDDDLAGPL